jgi:tripartite-type tricarboxylate transporter receptor subunit TctC
MHRAAAAILFAALAWGGHAGARDAASFYRGRQVSMFIGSPAGGGYDIYGRLLARHFGKHISGEPTIVPINMPGAASNAAAAHVYNIALKDGSALGAIFPGAVMDPLLNPKARPKHDASKFVYLGSAATDVFLCMVRADAPVKTFADTMTTEIILGASQAGGPTRDSATLLNALLGTKFRVVGGYPGTREILLALERGEVQGVCGMSWPSFSAQHPDWVKRGVVRLLVQGHDKGHPEINAMGVPLAVDFAKTPEDRQVMEFVYSQQTFGRPYVLPPGTPPDRVAVLRKAFLDALADPDLLAEAKRMGIDVEPIAGETLQSLVAKLYVTPTDVVERTREMLGVK